DSILIDEARTPLIISGMVADSAKWYQTFARIAPGLRKDDDYEVEESKRTVAVTEAGVAKVEERLGIDNLYEHVNTPLVHHLQNYFGRYQKLAGMTGTARTQLVEFEEVYKLGVVEIPTNRPMVRTDQQDVIYKNEDAKWNAVTEDIVERNEKGQPVLVGTVSIEKSEWLAGYLRPRGVPHHVVNRKPHAK